MSSLCRTTLGALTLTTILLAGGCGGGGSTASGRATAGGSRDAASTGGEAGAPATTTTSDPGAESAVTTTTPASASSLEGTWTAAIQDLLTGGAGGGAGGLTCDGSQTLTFRQGRNTIGGSGHCRMGTTEGTVRYDSSADYRTEGDQLILSNFADNTRLTMNGTDVGGALGTLGNGTVTYSIRGDVLTITKVDPQFGSLSQTYTRT